MQANISLCVINRDDSNNLVNLVSSARPWVKEIVLVDTGSIDNSVQRAYSAGVDVVISAPHLIIDGVIKSFSEARQLSYDNASCDWQLWLDTDDDLVGWDRLSELTSFADKTRDQTGPGFGVKLWYDYSWNQDRTLCTQSFRRERLTHRDDNWRWRRPVHEYLHYAGSEESQFIDGDIRVKHLSFGARGVKNDRNLRILRHWETEHIEEDDKGVLNYYLGEELFFRNQYKEAYEHYLLASQVLPTTWMYRAILGAGKVLMHAGHYQSAIDFFTSMIKQMPTVADFHLELSRALIIMGHFEDARKIFLLASDFKQIEGENPELKLVVASALGIELQ